jgi:CHAT domain-containing protein/cytochrome c-type biogenesis protein CcmH/NrfG
LPEDETPHLTDGQMIALPEVGGEGVVLRHLETCAECRARLAGWREARAIVSQAGAGPGMAKADRCPPMEELASYAAGASGERAESITAHVVGCARCAAILRDSLEESDQGTTPLSETSGKGWRRRMAEDFAGRPRPAAPAYWKYAAAAAVLLAVAGSSAVWWSYRRSHDPAILLARAYTAARPFAFRLPDAGYAPVRQRRGAGSTFEGPETLEAAVAAIRGELAAQPRSPRAWALKGRAELMEGDYESAIESLTRATQAADDAGALADLGVAYAMRGEGENRPIDYGHAADLLLRALKQRPGDPEAQFNLALIYEKLSQVDEGIAAWRNFLRGSPPDGWRQEAETHLAALEKTKAEKKKADGRVLRDPTAFLAAYGGGETFDPLPWYDVFWTDWLPKAELHQNAASAARVIAQGFARRREFSLIESLDAPAGAAKQDGVALLARAMIANRGGRPGEALAMAREAAAKLDEAGMRAAAALARNEFVYAARWADLYRECRETSELLLRSLGPRYPWLEGNAQLERAGCDLRHGDNGQARSEVERAEVELTRAGLWPIALRATQFKGVQDDSSGNYAPVWGEALSGLRRYWTSQATHYRAQAFEEVLARASAGLGWRDCAVAFCRGSIGFAHDAGNGEMEATNRSELAQLLHEMGDYPDEVRELDAVQRLLDGAGDSKDVRILRWEAALRRVEAGIATGGGRDSFAELDRLASDESGREVAKRIALEQTRGLAFAARGDFGRAAEAFRQAIARNAKRMRDVRQWVLRFPMLEAVAPSYRNLTQIELKQDGGAAKALETWREFRPEVTSARRSIAIAVLPAGIAIWTVDGGVVTARWADLPPDELRQASEEFLGLCASPTSGIDEIRRLGNRLYRALLGPELKALGQGTISLAADGWLAAIPYRALTDNAGEYLGRHFQFVAGYGPPATTAAQAISPGSAALIVTAPSAAAPGGPPLPVLAAAETEAAQVAARFTRAVMERRATVEWLAANAPRANVFHFCGHGWANGGNGALILPPGPDAEPRFVTSATLAGQDWSRCQLAVLSACLTAAGETRGAVNNQSLVQALLGAGARRVVAARWTVDSEATRALMDGFYQRLVSGKSVPEALSGAAADVAAVPGWSHPYYWAGFDVFGAA